MLSKIEKNVEGVEACPDDPPRRSGSFRGGLQPVSAQPRSRQVQQARIVQLLLWRQDGITRAHIHLHAQAGRPKVGIRGHAFAAIEHLPWSDRE